MFFVKYNDPIYVKLEKLDIMIRLASQANIAQVLASRASKRNHLRVAACVCVCLIYWNSKLKIAF